MTPGCVMVSPWLSQHKCGGGTLIALKQSELIKMTQDVHHCIRLTADWPISHVYQTVWGEDASQFDDKL
jgi:hypothetical protein